MTIVNYDTPSFAYPHKSKAHIAPPHNPREQMLNTFGT